MHHTYIPHGVCAKQITFEIERDTVRDIGFIGGCHGNLQGIARLAEGMQVEEVISRLRGVRCGAKATSCPDQLAKALEQVKKQVVQETATSADAS